ncbi:hypothetical protein MMC20_006833 [Loxospora ochrophaea]|nr:hypothetical protein [Loxospora ochrophaea]
MPTEMSACASCRNPLVLEIEIEDGDAEEDFGAGSHRFETKETVPDDTELPCGCHFHWECLLDAYNITECPSCETSLLTTTSSGQQQIICRLNNEGGVQDALDILPLLAEESYLKAYPEERKCRAYLEFCRNGDLEAVVELLQDEGTKVLRYQDPLGSMHSGLHVAVINAQVEIAWLLLLLSSSLEMSQFPIEVLEVAQQLGIRRERQAEMFDIRSLKDSNGMMAEKHAENIGGVWSSWLQAGLLRPPYL